MIYIVKGTNEGDPYELLLTLKNIKNKPESKVKLTKFNKRTKK